MVISSKKKNKAGKRFGEHRGWGVYVVFKGWSGRKSLIEPESSGRASHIDIQERNISGRRNGKCQGLEMEAARYQCGRVEATWDGHKK